MANPKGRVVMDEEQARAAEKHYAWMEATLQELQQQKQEVQRHLQEQQNIVETEHLRADRRSRVQTQEFPNLTTELLAGRRGPEVQMEGIRMGVKVEKPDTYDGDESRNLDTWLFQVCEHLNLTVIPKRGHVPYVTSLLYSNAALWWRKMCEGNHRPATWEDFCRVLREQLWPKDYGRRG